MRTGLKTYFAKYAYSNTELKDFLEEMNQAAIKLNIKEDFLAWSHSWLQTSGINVIECKYVEDDNTIKLFEIH